MNTYANTLIIACILATAFQTECHALHGTVTDCSGAPMFSNGNRLCVTFTPANHPTTDSVDVYVDVSGDDNAGLLQYHIEARNLTAYGIDSSALSFEPVILSNVSPQFEFVGFPTSNNLDGPSGDDVWSAGGSQFGVSNPIIGLGREHVFYEGARAIPNNPNIDVPHGIFGSYLGSVYSRGIPFNYSQLGQIFSGGGTLLHPSGDASRPVPLVPEPASALLTAFAASVCWHSRIRRAIR